jgi:hypothetical protein
MRMGGECEAQALSFRLSLASEIHNSFSCGLSQTALPFFRSSLTGTLTQLLTPPRALDIFLSI